MPYEFVCCDVHSQSLKSIQESAGRFVTNS